MAGLGTAAALRRVRPGTCHRQRAEQRRLPDEVEYLCSAEWATHLHQVLPLLAAHDAARHLAELTPAFDAARAPWLAGDIVGITRDQPTNDGA